MGHCPITYPSRASRWSTNGPSPISCSSQSQSSCPSSGRNHHPLARLCRCCGFRRSLQLPNRQPQGTHAGVRSSASVASEASAICSHQCQCARQLQPVWYPPPPTQPNAGGCACARMLLGGKEHRMFLVRVGSHEPLCVQEFLNGCTMDCVFGVGGDGIGIWVLGGRGAQRLRQNLVYHVLVARHLLYS